MKSEDCKRFESCRAPICPLDEDSFKCGIWYSGEDVCMLQGFCKLNLIQNQKKIRRRTRVSESFYTIRMLQRNSIVSKGISGLDPDHEITDMEKDEAKWMKEHPEKHTISEVRKEELRNRMMKIRQGLNPPEKDPNHFENSSFDKQSV